MKVLQGNLHRSVLADNLLTQFVGEWDVDLVFISEQHHDRDSPGWFSDSLGTAAIWIPDLRKFQILGHGAGEGFVWVRGERITAVSCYLTPNDRIAVFQAKLGALEDFLVEEAGDRYIVAGDFNARAFEWGMPETDTRGRMILELAARTGLVVVNEGNIPTFRRPGYRGTIPDVTFASENLMPSISGWRVVEDFTGSDHQYIIFSWSCGRQLPAQARNPRPVRWNVARLDAAALSATIEAERDDVLLLEDQAEVVAEATMQLISRACDSAMPRRSAPCPGRKPAYWWTDEIAALRRVCLRSRRRLARVRRGDPDAAAAAALEHREARNMLKRAIRRRKKEKWEELRRDVNRDPWGLGYRLVMRKLGAGAASPELDPFSMSRIVDALFPAHPIRAEERYAEDLRDVPLFTAAELTEAASLMRSGSAPGPDGVPTEVLKVVASTCPSILLNMYNRCLREGVFCRRWKLQRLTLISKGKGIPGTPSAYRPLCMLDTAGKLLERLLKPRLVAAVADAGGLSVRQHGFTKGRSTIGAIQEVVEAARNAQRGNHYSRCLTLLVTLDVRNAFNSASWSVMLRALEDVFHVPEYLLRILRSYLRDRELIFQTSDGPRRRIITAGAAQGSILGPDLWNISYDGILRLALPEDSFLVGYADDVAAVIVARDVQRAQWKLNQTMRLISRWMEDHGLSLATEKTEIVMMTGRRIPTLIDFRVDAETIRAKPAVNYLGVRLDTKLSFREQIRYAVEKAGRTTTALSRLMANVGGPTADKRKLLMSVTNSILLYGCEVWADTLKKECYRKQMGSVQRRAALRIASAYRTVSEPASLVVAGVVPIDLLAQERKQVFHTKSVLGVQEATRVARAATMATWRERWNRESRGAWTRRIIPDLSVWVERDFGEVNFLTTQLLTGHGLFRDYLHKMGKVDSPACRYGDAPRDDAHHTFFVCERWAAQRRILELEVGAFSPETLVPLMTASPENWRRISAFVEAVLRRKKIEEDQDLR